jgi:hypothetical protein
MVILFPPFAGRRRSAAQYRFHVHKATLRSGIHSFFERFRHPRIVMFHDILRHLRPFVGGQTFELLNDFCRAQNLISRQNIGKVKRVKSGYEMCAFLK